MHARTSKPALAAILVALAALAAYWYWSPLLALRSMQSAARTQDAAGFNAHVDYPKLRASLKQQLAVVVGEKIAPDNPLAAFGAMMGAALADKLVDAMVRPETVMRAMQSGQFGRQAGAPEASRAQNVQHPQPKWDWVRVGSDKLIAYRQDGSADAGGKNIEIVFERSGFANWKLTALGLPSIRH